MSETIQNISDTAKWVAYYRALESDRPDALFKDPYAKKLAGKKGVQIIQGIDKKANHAWALVVRTYVLDEIILRLIREQKVDTVLNLACGLDTRPFRLDLPASLRWIEVDLPGLLSYKKKILSKKKPTCRLEHVELDLKNIEERREFFSQVNQESKKVLVLTEGLLIYLSEEENRSFAQDLQAQSQFYWWLMDIYSPVSFIKMPTKLNQKLSAANSAFKFTPMESSNFFKSFGWNEIEFRSYLEEGRKIQREPNWAWVLRFLMKLVPKKHHETVRRSVGIALLENGGKKLSPKKKDLLKTSLLKGSRQRNLM